MERWFVVRHKPQKLHLALDHLGRQGFESYSPQGKISGESRPVFAGYFFVKTALSAAAWRAINGTRGVIHLLSPHPLQPPSPVPTPEVEALMEKEKAGKLCFFEPRRLRAGDKVQIRSGPLADRICQIETTNQERCILLLQLLGATTRVSAPAHMLSLVSSRAAVAQAQ